jgi:outer membrane autotransporter protein
MVRRARRLRLLASTAILLAALLPHNSLANDDCGPAPSAVCDAGDAGYPTFANGIIYDPVADLTLVVDSGAEIIPNSGIEGIFIHSAGGNIDLTLEDGASVATTGSYGVHIAYNHNDVSMTLSPGGSITTNGKFARGIEIFDTTGNVKLGSYGTIVTSGTDADGIEVSYTNGSLDVTASGAITTSGNSAHGIRLSYSYGTVSLDSSATIIVSGDGADGIHIANYSDFITDISLDLAGSIDVQGTGAAIRIIGNSPATLDNTGTIDGTVITGDGNDQFTNAGVLRAGLVDMGAGDDTLINTGTLELDGTSGAIADVESFTNSGIIDLANGFSGDSLSISGTFISAGGFLYLDASLDSGTADFLTLAAVAPSSNPTFIHVTDVGGSGTALTPILIIDAGSDASNGRAFVSLPLGAYQYDLTYDASAFDWYLGPLGIFPGTAQYPALVSGALLAFQSDLPSLHTRLQDLRWMDEDEKRIEPAAWTGWSPKLRPWLQLTSTRQEIGNDTPFDLGVTKLEAGLDSRWERGDALYSFGVFAGAGRSLQDFSDSTTHAEASLLLAGLYGGYRLGGLYGDAIVKYERQLTDYRGIATADEDAPFTVDLLGLSLEAGYRFALPRAYLQPRLRLAYAHAWAGSFEDASGATIDLDSAKSLRGEIGTRLGAPLMGLADVYADASLGREFLDETQAQVSGLSFTHELPASSARLASGFAVNLLDEKLTLSVEASYSRGEDAEEFAATGGLRLHN